MKYHEFCLSVERLDEGLARFKYKIFAKIPLPPRAPGGTGDYTYGNIDLTGIENKGFDEIVLDSKSKNRPLRHAARYMEPGDCYFIPVHDDPKLIMACFGCGANGGEEYKNQDGRRLAYRYDSEKRILGVWRLQ